jgi:hypothetical protein
MCGAGTTPTADHASEDADLLHRIARADAEKRDAYGHFDRYYARDEHDRRAA